MAIVVRSCIVQQSAGHFQVQLPPNKGSQEGASGSTQRQHLCVILADSNVESVLLSFSACIVSVNIRSKQLADMISLYRVKQRKHNWVLSTAATLIAMLLLALPHCLRSDLHMK